MIFPKTVGFRRAVISNEQEAIQKLGQKYNVADAIEDAAKFNGKETLKHRTVTLAT